MKKILTALTLATSVMLSTQASAVIIDASTVIPNENILLNFNGLDWVYAGPIPTEYFGPGNLETPEYRASEGWRYATDEEWALRPDWTDFIIGGVTLDPVSGFGDHSKYRFASEYWSNYNHIDLSDAANGMLTNGEYINWKAGYETWYVRDARISTDVPESSSIMLLGLGLLGLAFARRKHNK
ncbi:MAG TPA: PEP-CTERM sorting domain-containing protein [Cellvibrio sp.]